MTAFEIKEKLRYQEFEISLHAFEEAVDDFLFINPIRRSGSITANAKDNLMTTCSKCRSAMTSGTTDVNFNRNGLHVQIKNVPASLGTNCDNKTLEGKVALYIDRIVQAIFAAEQPIRVRELVLEAA